MVLLGLLLSYFFFPDCCFSQEVENLRKQAEIIPQLMAECENITAKLQVHYRTQALHIWSILV